MREYKSNHTKAVYAIDFDDVLAFGPDHCPRTETVRKIHDHYYSGDIIIIWTARSWAEAPSLVAWLTKHDVPFHGIQMSKGGADIYVDDKAQTFLPEVQDD